MSTRESSRNKRDTSTRDSETSDMPRRNKKSKKISSPKEEYCELVKVCRGENLSLSSLREKIESCSEEAIRAHGTDNTLLHYVCMNALVTLEIVEYLVNLYPEAVRHVTSGDRLPLHQACLSNSCPDNVVEYLFQKYPDAVRMATNDPFGLPLHCLLWRSSDRLDDDLKVIETDIRLDLGLVELLVRAYPEALTAEPCTPLLLACRRRDVSLEMVQLLTGDDFAPLSITGFFTQSLPLHEIFNGNGGNRRTCPPIDVVEFFLENSPEEALNTRDIDGFTPFHCACSKRNVSLEIIRLFVERRHDLLEDPTLGDSLALNLPLHEFCRNDNVESSRFLEILEYLVNEHPAAVETANAYQMLPLSYVASKRGLDAVKYLVERYPQSVRGGSVELAILPACRNGSLEVVKYLYGVFPEALSEATSSGKLPLHNAAARGDSAKIRFVLEKFPKGAEVADNSGNTPLHYLCKSDSKDLSMYRELFDAHPPAIHMKNREGSFPVHCLFSRYRKSSREVINFLIKQLPYSVKEVDGEGRTLLHLACSTWKVSLDDIKYVVKFYPGAVRINSEEHGLPVHVASERESVDIVKYLVSLYPESLNVCNEIVGVPLECARESEVFEYLLQQRYAGYWRKHGVFPLHAILKDNGLKSKIMTAEKLLDHFGVHAEDVDRSGASALHVAVTEGLDTDFIELLTNLYPDAIELQNSQGSLPLHNAVRLQPSLELVRLLLGDGEARNQRCIHAVDRNGCTALHVACRRGASVDVIQHLVEMDAMTMEMQDENREIPLHKACRGGHAAIVQYLVGRNMPSASQRNAAGSLPVFILAQSSGKDRDALDTPEYVEALFKLMLAHPESVMSALE